MELQVILSVLNEVDAKQPEVVLFEEADELAPHDFEVFFLVEVGEVLVVLLVQ